MSAPANPQEAKSRWLDVLEPMTREEVVATMTAIVQHAGPMPDEIAEAFRETLKAKAGDDDE